jgi:hypothetical protein
MHNSTSVLVASKLTFFMNISMVVQVVEREGVKESEPRTALSIR